MGEVMAKKKAAEAVPEEFTPEIIEKVNDAAQAALEKRAAEPGPVQAAPPVPEWVGTVPVTPPLKSGEPFFVLRGSDLLAAYLVEKWASNAEAQGTNPATVQAARETALRMQSWPNRKYPE
jgi:hypothetical protein